MHLRWFMNLFWVFMVMSLPVVVVVFFLLWLLYYFLSGRQPKWRLRDILARLNRTFEPALLLLACLLTVASLFITQDVGSHTLAGFPFQFVTIFPQASSFTTGSFLDRLAPAWNVNGLLFANILFYYIFIVICRQFGFRSGVQKTIVDG